MLRQPLQDVCNVHAAVSQPVVGPYACENDSSSLGTFSALQHAFSQRIAELQQLICMRIEDSARGLFEHDLEGLEASVRALEALFANLRQLLQREMAVVPKARALLQACHMQQEHLQQVVSGLPQRLPSVQLAAPAGAPPAAATAAPSVGGRHQPSSSEQRGPQTVIGAAPASTQAGDGERKRRESSAPRWYITQADLASLASYMRGRLTLDKVNAAIDELAGFAEVNHRWMQAVRSNSMLRIPADERKRASELYHSIASKDSVKGRFFFVDGDLKSGASVKLDKSGKSLLMVLRHLGRLQEVRANVEALGGATSVYVLQQP